MIRPDRNVALCLQEHAKNLSYNGPVDYWSPTLKIDLLEAAHRLDAHDIRVHGKSDGLLIINARGKSRFMSWRERLAYWLLGNKTEIRP